MIRFGHAAVNDLKWHYAATGADDAPLMLFLHGFPEFWYGWKPVIERLGGRFHCVAPDLTGYNLSDKPTEVARYRTRRLIDDVLAFAACFPPRRRFHLVAHDWGGALAWAIAIRHPERLASLSIVNAVHPAAFQREIARNREQAEASQYIHALRAPDAEARYAADNYALLWRSLEGPFRAGHLSEADRAAYLKAWAQPGALTGMFNWYRAMRMSPPGEGRPAEAGMYDAAALTVRVPTLVLWGLKDEALRPGCIEGLEEFVPGVTLRTYAEGTHWLIHEAPQTVAEEIAAFAGAA